MRMNRVISGISLVLAACQVPSGGPQSAASGPRAGGSDIGGVVTSAGWKGRALWSTYATRAPFHVEGGKGTRSKVLKFQLRPDPLAN